MSETATFCAVCGARFDAPEMQPPMERSAPPTEEAVGQPAEAGIEEAEAHKRQDEAEPEAEEPVEDPYRRRMTEVAALLEDAAGAEEADAGRAATLYGDAIVACLEATEDPLGSQDVLPVLLRSFDCLSSLLERGGLPDEALSVVDDAASLGLLNGGDEARNGGDEATTVPREALESRRENLRRILFADSAQL